VQSSIKIYFACFSLANRAPQVFDLKGFIFCFLFRHFVETRVKSGLSGCQVAVVHKVIHRDCGYCKNAL
jgi:hypothetical protein